MTHRLYGRSEPCTRCSDLLELEGAFFPSAVVESLGNSAMVALIYGLGAISYRAVKQHSESNFVYRRYARARQTARILLYSRFNRARIRTKLD